MRQLFLAVSLVASSGLADSLDPSVSGLLTRTDLVTGQGPITDFRWLPDGRLVFTEKTGAVKVRSVDGAISTAYTFCVNTVSEQGLLGVEVDPDFGLGTNHRLFFYYSNCAADGGADNDRHRVVSITLDPVTGTLDASSERVLVRGLRGPANHDGGGLAIGPDRKLYIGVGDTGCNCGCAPGNATNHFATCLSASPAGDTGGNGKVLRVNLDGTIPADNPLVDLAQVTACGASCTAPIDPAITGPPRLDVWAWGFRNPFRLWTDPLTGNLWVGDVGEVSVEELDLLQRGRHFGWPFREGWSGQDAGVCDHWTPGAGACVEPAYACRHNGFADPRYDPSCTAITLGAIVDHCAWPTNLRGRMYFGDSSSGALWSLPLNAARDAPAGPRENLGVITGGGPVAFQVGPEGNLYIAVYPGRIVGLAPTTPLACDGGAGGGTGGGGTGGGSATTDGGGTGGEDGGSGAADGGGGEQDGGGGEQDGGGGEQDGGGGEQGGGGGEQGGGGGEQGGGGGEQGGGGGEQGGGGGEQGGGSADGGERAAGGGTAAGGGGADGIGGSGPDGGGPSAGGGPPTAGCGYATLGADGPLLLAGLILARRLARRGNRLTDRRRRRP